MIWSSADKLINQLGFLGVTLFIAKSIGPESFGLIGMLAFFILLTDVVNNGFSQALVQRSKNLTEKDESTTFYINILWALVIYFILYNSAPWISDFYGHHELTSISRYFFLVIIINSIAVVARAKLIIDVDFKTQAAIGLISVTVSSTISIILVLNKYDYWAYVWLIVSKALVQSALLFLFSKWRPKLLFCVQSFKKIFGFGSKIMLAGILNTFSNNMYVVFIGRYFDAATVGYFTQGNNLTNFLSGFVSSVFQSVTFPILASIQEEKEHLKDVYKKVISITMLVSLPALIGFAAVADDFVMLVLGKEWSHAIPIIQILCFARAIVPISVVNLNLLNAIGRSDLFLKIDLIKLPMTLLSIFISVQIGVVAVSWAMLITVCIAFFINAYYPGKLYGFGAWEQIKIAKNYMISAAAMFVSVRFLSLGTLGWDLIGGIVLGVIVYFSFLWVLRDIMFLKVASECYSKITNLGK